MLKWYKTITQGYHVWTQTYPHLAILICHDWVDEAKANDAQRARRLHWLDSWHTLTYADGLRWGWDLGRFAVDVSRCFEALAWQNEHCAAASQWNEYLGVRIIRISSISKYHKVIFLAHFFFVGPWSPWSPWSPGARSQLDAGCLGSVCWKNRRSQRSNRGPKSAGNRPKKNVFLEWRD